MRLKISCEQSRQLSKPAGYTLLLLTLALGLLQGCFGIGPKVGPDYSPPQLEMQDAWHQAITKGLAEGKANLQTWWNVFNDPVLNGLVERSGQHNLELKEAFISRFTVAVP